MRTMKIFEQPADKSQLYSSLEEGLLALVEGVSRPMPNLANASALLWQGLADVNWVGFYLMDDGNCCGPFRTNLPACASDGQGVCGTR